MSDHDSGHQIPSKREMLPKEAGKRKKKDSITDISPVDLTLAKNAFNIVNKTSDDTKRTFSKKELKTVIEKRTAVAHQEIQEIVK